MFQFGFKNSESKIIKLDKFQTQEIFAFSQNPVNKLVYIYFRLQKY